MRCKNCIALNNAGYEYPEWECLANVPEEKTVGFDDGECGCKFSKKAIEQRIKKYEDMER